MIEQGNSIQLYLENLKNRTKQLSHNTLVLNTANKKNIAKTILVGFGKVFYYFGVGIWIFCKLLGRGIQRAFDEHEARRRAEHHQPYYTPTPQTVIINNQTVYSSTHYPRETPRKPKEKTFQQSAEEVWGVPRVNKNAILGEPPTRKKKRRSPLEF